MQPLVQGQILNPSQTSIYIYIYIILCIYILMYFWLCWVFVVGFSLVAVSRGYSLVGVHGLLIVVASLVVEHRL